MNLGIVWGLHTTNRSRIMCTVGDGRYVNTPTYADLETINHIYG